jgi:hypothetical protein
MYVLRPANITVRTVNKNCEMTYFEILVIYSFLFIRFEAFTANKSVAIREVRAALKPPFLCPTLSPQ